MITLMKLCSKNPLFILFKLIIFIFFHIQHLNASPCKKIAENIYKLKPTNVHRLCLMNEFSETPAHYVYDCKKRPNNFFFRNKKILFSEVENETLCTDKFILNTCNVDEGFDNGPKFMECRKIKIKYRGLRF